MSSSTTTVRNYVPTRNSKRRKTKGGFTQGGTASSSVMQPLVRDVPFPLRGTRSDQTYEFSQSYELTSWAVSSITVPTFTSNNFTLNSLDQVSSLVAVFDQYMIANIRIQLIPRANVVDGTIVNSGLFTSLIDLDDVASLSTIGQAQDFQTALSSRGTETHVRTFKPRVAIAAYSGAFTSYANMGAQWIDTSSTTVQHYGIKTAWTATSIILTYDAVITFLVKFRNVR